MIPRRWQEQGPSLWKDLCKKAERLRKGWLEVPARASRDVPAQVSCRTGCANGLPSPVKEEMFRIRHFCRSKRGICGSGSRQLRDTLNCATSSFNWIAILANSWDACWVLEAPVL